MFVDSLTVEELRAAFSFGPVERAKLVKAAGRLAAGTEYAPGDLLSEAVVRALDGSRLCPRNVPPIAFLWNVMRSIASTAWEAEARAPTVEAISLADGDGGVAIADAARSPEELVIAKDDYTKRVDALQRVFEDDQEALLVIMGELDGMTAEEIRSVTGLSETAYATIRRRIRRALDRAYPEGWEQ